MKKNLIRFLTLFLVYISLLNIDNYVVLSYYNKHLNAKLDGLNALNKNYNLILGGSNSFYSISGKLLTELSDESWYNLSISGEGQNNSNYLSFLEDKISYDYRNKIKQIIYSSIYYYRKGTIEHREISSNLIDGSKKFSLKPTTSGFTYVKRLILNGKIMPDYPVQNQYGDFVFTEKTCSNHNITQKFNIENFKIIKNDLNYKLEELERIFPNAKITIIFPSDYIEKSNLYKYQSEISQLEKYLKSNLDSKNKFIFQDPLTYDYVCDDASHANIQGNIWRTQNLFNKLY